MSTETRSETTTSSGLALDHWQAGVLGGIVAGVVFGVMMAMQMEPVLQNAIPAMYGFGPDAGALGFAIHVVHGAVLGVAFAAIVDLAGLRDVLDDNLKTGLAGLGYGLLIWVALAVVVMPLWLQAVGFGGAPDVPNVAMESLVGHAVYGVVLGIVYSVLAKV